MGTDCKYAKGDEAVLIDTIFTAIKVKLALVEATEQAYTADRQAKEAKYHNTKRELETRLKKLTLSHAKLLEDYLEGKITKDELQAKKSQIADSVSESEKQLSALGTLAEQTSELVEQHKPYYKQEVLSRDMVQSLIKEVRVYSETGFEIVWKFSECYTQIKQGFMPNLVV